MSVMILHLQQVEQFLLYYQSISFSFGEGLRVKISYIMFLIINYLSNRGQWTNIYAHRNFIKFFAVVQQQFECQDNRLIVINEMDNFHLQITPVELSYQSKDSMPVSCLVKKVAISTGHTLQKYQIKSTSQIASGKAYFKEGPTFSMNKEFEARNTKISLHFLVTKDRNITCIGSTQLDVAVLSNQPCSLIEIGLNNCNDPKARLKIQIHRKENNKRQLIKQTVKPQPMTLLNTEGQIRQQHLSSRRGSTNIPNAYQISRKNYKQAEIVRQQRRNQSKKSSASSKGSYKNKHNIATHNAFVRMNKATNIEEGALKKQSPMPRKKTPQPIKFQNVPKRQAQQSKQTTIYQRFSISHRNTVANNQKIGQNNSNKGINQHIQEPQRLKVKPYQQKKSQNNQNINSNISFRSLQDEKNHKYKVITQKLQIIHDKIAHSKEKNRVNTEQNLCNNSEYSYSSQQNPHSCFEKSYTSEAESSSNQKKSIASGVQSFNPYINSRNTIDANHQSPILGQCTASTEELIEANKKTQKSKPIQKRFEDIANLIQLKQKVAEHVTQKQSMLKTDELMQQSSPSVKSPQHHEQQIQDIDIYRMQSENTKKQLQDLKNQYYSMIKATSQKDKRIQSLEVELKSYKQLLNEKQTTLNKLNQSYQNHLQEIFHLRQKVQELEKSNKTLKNTSSKIEKSTVLPENSTQNQSNTQKIIEEQLLRTRKKIVELQTQLKFKQNDNKCLLLEIDNIKRQRNTLQQEVGLIIKNDKNELTRKASLARLEQMNSGSLAQHTRRQNEALKNEVKILQEKLVSLNSLFQSLIKNDDISKTTLKVIEGQSIDLSNKCRLLQQKCQILQQELKKKKNELAEIINIIWKHEDCQLMNDVFALITSNQAQSLST